MAKWLELDRIITDLMRYEWRTWAKNLDVTGSDDEVSPRKGWPIRLQRGARSEGLGFAVDVTNFDLERPQSEGLPIRLRSSPRK